MAKSNQNKSDTDEEKELRDLKNQLSNLISQSKLDPREKEVLKLRFGTEDDQSLTIEEVALHLNLTAQEIEQIEVNALKKIRPRKKGRLKNYLI